MISEGVKSALKEVIQKPTDKAAVCTDMEDGKEPEKKATPETKNAQ